MSQNLPRKLFTLTAVILAIWLTLRYLMPILTPFLLALLLALAAEPLVKVFHRKMHLPRGAATGIGVTMTLVLLILLIMVLGALILRELGALAGVVPDLEGTALQGMESLEGWLLGMAGRTPDSIQPILTHSVEGMFSDSTALLDQVTSKLLSLASGVVSKLPDSALGVGTWLLASFMISAKLPKIKAWVNAHLPASWHEKYLPMLRRIKKSVFGWLLAQCKLMSITFLVLTVGFFVLQIRYAPLWAFVVALVDALPVLGTGTVLIPWSLVCFLQGDTVRGIGLLGVYAAASLTRSVLEPRLIGRQLGLDPLITLLAMYAGYRIWGLAGMILAPLLAVTVSQFFISPKEG